MTFFNKIIVKIIFFKIPFRINSTAVEKMGENDALIQRNRVCKNEDHTETWLLLFFLRKKSTTMNFIVSFVSAYSVYVGR